MEIPASICKLYGKVAADCPLKLSDVEEIVHLLRNYQLEWVHPTVKTGEHGMSRRSLEESLLLFSIISRASSNRLWPDDVCEVLDTISNFQLLCWNMDASSMALSYSSSRAIAELVLHIYPPLSVIDKVGICLSDLLQHKVSEVNGWIQRLDLFKNILSCTQCGIPPDDRRIADLQHSMCVSLASHWQQLTTFVFDSELSIHHNGRWALVVHAVCCLWNQLIKFLLSSGDRDDKEPSSGLQSLFICNNVLLDQIESGMLPAMCRHKCLGVLRTSLPYVGICMNKTQANCYVKLAQQYLLALYCGAFQSSSPCVKQWVIDFMTCEFPAKRSFAGTRYAEKKLEKVENVSVAEEVGCIVFPEPATPTYQDSAVNCQEGEHTFSCSQSAVVMSGEGKIAIAEEAKRLQVLLSSSTCKIIRRIASLAVRSVAVLCRADGGDVEIKHPVATIKALMSKICCLFQLEGIDMNKLLVAMFNDRDDALFDILVCLLHVHIWEADNRTSPSTTSNEGVEQSTFDPCILFLYMLETLSWDESVLLDFVMSPETCCLLYMTCYLRYILRNWSHWELSCRQFAVVEKSVDIEIAETNISQLEDAAAVPHSSNETCKRKRSPSHSETVVVESVENSKFARKRRNISSVERRQVNPDSRTNSRLLVAYSSSSDEDADCCENIDRAALNKANNDDDYLSFSHNLNDIEPSRVLDKAMTVLIQLRILIERLVCKSVFPFKIEPFLDLLSKCEFEYDST